MLGWRVVQTGDKRGRKEHARGGDILNWEWVKLIWLISEYDKEGVLGRRQRRCEATGRVEE